MIASLPTCCIADDGITGGGITGVGINSTILGTAIVTSQDCTISIPNYVNINSYQTNINSNSSTDTSSLYSTNDYYNFSISYIDIWTSWTIYNYFNIAPDKKTLFRQQIRNQLSNHLESKNNKLMQHNKDENEIRARGLLCELVGKCEFKKYMQRGFLTIQSKSGIWYKVPGGHDRMISYVKDKDGKFVPYESFCIVFKDSSLPHTDYTIMRLLLIENDEFAMRKQANINFVGSFREQLSMAETGMQAMARAG